MLVWDSKKQGDELLFVFSGEIDETADLQALRGLTGRATFDLKGITRINSEGARLWINLMRTLASRVKLSFVRCSIPVVIQMNMIFGFRGNAEVRSFYAPYLCEITGQEEEKLLTREQLQDPYEPPSFPCAGGLLELDDLPERYFAFLLEDPQY